MGHEAAHPEPVAIVGISALYPEARGVTNYWNLLTATDPPASSGTDREQGPARARATLADIEIDVARFRIPPSQARSLARMQLLMLEAARQCLDDAGDRQRLPADRTDVVVGTCFGLDRQYANALRIEGAHYGRHLGQAAARADVTGSSEASRTTEDFRAALRSRLGASPHDRVGEMASTIPARIAAVHGLRGRTLALESADATSYLAISHALDNLRAGLSDAVLVLTGQRVEGRFAGHALAGKGLTADRTRPFAADGDGFAVGEGVGGVLLKRLSSADRDGDRVYASILACSLRHDARSGVFRYSTSHEQRAGTAAAAYRRSGVPAASVQYVESAGSGIAPETRSELDALAAVFEHPASDSAAAPRPAAIALGSVRDRLDHTFANAGLAGISKVALALHHRRLPPQYTVDGDARLDLRHTPFRVLPTAEKWQDPPGGAPRRAAVSGSSLTGTLCHLVLEEHRPATTAPRPIRRSARLGTEIREPIAVVGFGGCFADSPDADAYWATMCSGRDRIAPLPASLFDRDLYHAPDRMSLDRSYLDAGAPVLPPQAPPAGLSIPPRRYAALDSAQRLALSVTAEVFARRGQGPGTLKGQGVVAVGTNLGLARERQLNAGLCLDELEAVARGVPGLDTLGPDEIDGLLKLVRDRCGDPATADPLSMLDGALAGGVPALIANEFGLSAVPVAVEAACASSLAALDLAVTRLRSGAADYAIAGGVELPCNPRDLVLCSSLGLLSRDRITPFDTAADGFTPGDGCALFLLRRYEDACRDGEPVFGLVRAVGASNDAKSLIAPDAAGQVRAMRQAFAQVDYGPSAVGYLEAHGTGTRVGDRTETEATADVYSSSLRQRPLEIGSAKSFIGHTFAAAGGAGLLRALQALRTRTIPGNTNLRTLNPELALARIPARVSTEAGAWKARDGQPRRAAVSSFGTGGINYHLLVEEHMDGTR